ncbi:MAG: DUF2130 domain-containing protein [Bacteroidetes bacterium]|nr:DUF2130 domain-containing protein [Bacteroidota bacterium]
MEAEKLRVKKLIEEQDDIIRGKLIQERGKLMKEAEFNVKRELEFEMMKLKQDMDAKSKENRQFRMKELDVLNKERDLKEKEEQMKLEMKKKMLEMEEEIKEKVIRAEKEKNEVRILEVTKQLDEQNNQLNELKKKEIEFKNKEQELKDREEQLKIEMEKQMFDNAKIIEDKILKREQEKNELKNREYEKQLEDQKKLIDELKKKAEQGSMQLQGEVQELALEEFLRNAYPFDKITEVKKGEKGADAVQIVVNSFQQECGRIIYESKRTKAFSEGWIEKLKEDQKKQQADISVIVTESMPKDMERFGQRNGVWICSFSEVKGLSLVLREMLLRTHSMKSVNENRSDKMEMLYSYLTSNEFRQQVESIVEGFTSLQNDINKEKIAMEKMWSSREKQIRKVLVNTSSMFGSIKGLAGNSIQDIKALEMPDEE